MRTAHQLHCRILCYVICVLSGNVVCRTVRGDDDFPYTAYVRPGHQAQVHSGPGNDYYTTDRLEPGSEIEVYKLLNEEWAAIRPPSGSFSLVPVSALHVSGSNDLGTVETEVKTIVGSRLGHGRHNVEYVTLLPGEVVQVLGSTEVELEDGQDLMCYEIAPPAGEFRWVRIRDISREPTRDSPQKDRHENERPTLEAADQHELVNFEDGALPLSSDRARRTDRRNRDRPIRREAGEVQSLQFTVDPDGLTSSEASPSTERIKLVEVPESVSPPADAQGWNLPNAAANIAAGNRSPAAQNQAEPLEPPSPNDNLGLVPPPPAQPPRSAVETDLNAAGSEGKLTQGDSLPSMRSFSTSSQPLELGPIGKLRLGQELIDIELQLTKQVCQSPATWHLSDLRSRAQAVIDASDDPRQRATAQNVIAKIAQFEDVRRRQKTLVSTNFPRNTAASQIVSRDVPGAGDEPYDGTGFLMPVVTQDPNIPKYVLTDEEGNIIQFVSPKPGMSLKRFEQQRVGILGERLSAHLQPAASDGRTNYYVGQGSLSRANCDVRSFGNVRRVVRPQARGNRR